MLVETTDLSGVVISPDGRLVAFRTERASIERNTYDARWFVVNLAAPEAPLPVADGGVPLRDAAGVSLNEMPQWSPDSQWIYFRALIDGEVQVWRAASDGSRAEQVTQDGADIVRYRLSPDGRTVVYEVGASRDTILHAERMQYDVGVHFDDTVSGERNLFDAAPVNGRLAARRTTGEQGLLWDAPKVFRSINLDRRETMSASQRQADSMRTAIEPGIRSIAPSPDGRWVATLLGQYPASRLSARDTANGREMICGPCGDLVVDGIAWRGSTEIVFTARRPGFENTLLAWRPGEPEVRTVLASTGLLGADRFGQGSTCAMGEQYAVCVTAAAVTPPALERIDLATGQRITLADPNAGLASRVAETVSVELLQWEDGAGHHFSGQLLLPKARRTDDPLPLFITYYRCPGFMRGGYGDEWPLIPMAIDGIAALCINMVPADADAEVDYDIALGGIRTVIDILAGRGIVARDHVGIGGLSFGSEVAVWVAARSDLVDAVSIANTQASPEWYWANALLAGRSESIRARWGLGRPEETPEKWARLSPAAFATEFHTPILMQLPEGEYRANLEFHSRLVQRDQPSDLWVFPNETHQKYQPRHKEAAYERNLDWFRFWLTGYVDPAPWKARQYEHWIGLRDARPTPR